MPKLRKLWTACPLHIMLLNRLIGKENILFKYTDLQKNIPYMAILITATSKNCALLKEKLLSTFLAPIPRLAFLAK